jgi:hypothetical protein
MRPLRPTTRRTMRANGAVVRIGVSRRAATIARATARSGAPRRTQIAPRAPLATLISSAAVRFCAVSIMSSASSR